MPSHVYREETVYAGREGYGGASTNLCDANGGRDGSRGRRDERNRTQPNRAVLTTAELAEITHGGCARGDKGLPITHNPFH